MISILNTSCRRLGFTLHVFWNTWPQSQIFYIYRYTHTVASLLPLSMSFYTDVNQIFFNARILENGNFNSILCYSLVSESHFWLAGYKLDNKSGEKKAGGRAIIFNSTLLARDLYPAPLCYSLKMFSGFFKFLWKPRFQEISCNAVLGKGFSTEQSWITKMSEMANHRRESTITALFFPYCILSPCFPPIIPISNTIFHSIYFVKLHPALLLRKFYFKEKRGYFVMMNAIC